MTPNTKFWNRGKSYNRDYSVKAKEPGPTLEQMIKEVEEYKLKQLTKGNK